MQLLLAQMKSWSKTAKAMFWRPEYTAGWCLVSLISYVTWRVFVSFEVRRLTGTTRAQCVSRAIKGWLLPWPHTLSLSQTPSSGRPCCSLSAFLNRHPTVIFVWNKCPNRKGINAIICFLPFFLLLSFEQGHNNPQHPNLRHGS